MDTVNYTRIAHYYDLMHAGFSEDLPFLLSVAPEAGGRVLELGCGTGRVIFPLALAGHFVIGLDKSWEMLAIAGRKSRLPEFEGHAPAQLVLGDMCMPPVRKQSISLALAAHNTFMHLAPVEALTSLRAIRRCLAPGGRLVLDLANPFTLWQMSNSGEVVDLEQVLEDPETGETVRVSSLTRLDEEAQILRVIWYYDIAPAGAPLTRRETALTDYHFLFPHEMERMLHDAGLVLTELLGDYDHSPFEESSPRMIVIAEKRDERYAVNRA